MVGRRCYSLRFRHFGGHPLKGVLENPKLPSHGELAAAASSLARMPAAELQGAYRRYAEGLARRYGRERSLPSELAGMLRSGAYATRASREEMEAALALEVMKCYLQKNCSDPQLAASLKK